MKATRGIVPRHIGVILDGSRRFAKRLMLKPWMGHEWGANKVKKLYDWCRELGVKELTVYAFSLENFGRPKREFDYLMSLFKKEFNNLKNDPRLKDTRVNFIGRIWMFPKDIQDIMYSLMQKTKRNKKFIMTFAMAYSGRAEIVDAVKKIAEAIKKRTLNIKKINEETFKNYLYGESEPDLIIRTAESRISGFLLYQGAYSEIIFLPDKLWPEFEKEDFSKCIEEYQRRERRFGK